MESKKSTAISQFYSLIPGESKVLVALSGGVDSAVAAYLLTKQNIEVAGISFYNYDKVAILGKLREMIVNLEENNSVYFKQELKTLTDDQLLGFVNSSYCSAESSDKIEELANFLKIPLYGVKLEDVFDEVVFAAVVANRLLGRSYNPCSDCNRLKISTLFNKMETLKYDFMATGHYAKVYHNHKLESYLVFASNDQESDQSFLLSGVTQKELSRLILPLADLKHEAVLNLAKKFNLPFVEKKKTKKVCFLKEKSLEYFIQSKAPEKILKIGAVYNKEMLQLGEHMGIHKFYVGDKLENIEYKVIGSSTTDKESVVTGMSYSGGMVKISTAEKSAKKRAVISQADFIDVTDFSSPQNVLFRLDQFSPFKKAVLTMKNNKRGILDFAEKEFPLARGQVLAFYTTDKNPRLIGHARVIDLEDSKLLTRLKQSNVDKDDKEKVEEDSKKIKKIEFVNSF